MLSYLKRHYLDLILLAVLLIIAGTAHAYNMFHFPYYENDEGAYLSYAWSFLTQGKLAPYTYWYDHSPAGWIFMAIWAKLSGGFFTFGPSVNSGRVFMLLLHLGTIGFLYYIVKRLTNSRLAVIIAVLIFALTPLGIYYQRRVLLDNIMIFWVFLSLALLYKTHLRLSAIALSAITFGIAVLFLIIGGFWYITSAGNEETAAKGKSTVINAIIGIVIIILSYVIINVVSNLVSGGSNGVTGP